MTPDERQAWATLDRELELLVRSYQAMDRGGPRISHLVHRDGADDAIGDMITAAKENEP